MSGGYQIGRDVGELKARVDALEGGRQRSGKTSASFELTDTDRRVLQVLREHHREIVQAFEEFCGTLPFPSKLRLRSFTLIDADRFQAPAGMDEDCCICCGNGEYCCDNFGCSACC